MEKRTLIAIALSFLVLGFYPLILQKFYPAYKTQSTRSSAALLGGPKNAVSGGSPVKSISAVPESFSRGKDVRFRNEKLELLFNEKGGAIREISFPQFVDSETKYPLKLLSQDVLKDSPTLLNVTASPLEFGGRPDSYEIAHPSPNEFILTANALENKLRVTKEYLFKSENYDGRLIVKFENISDGSLEFYYELFAGSGIPPRHSIDSQYIEANFFLAAGGKNEIQHFRGVKQGKIIESPSFVDWVAIKDRHFSIILKPSGHNFKGVVKGIGNRNFSVSLGSEKITIPPGGAVSHEFLVYTGPNEIEELLPLGLDPIVNFGKLDAIGKVLVGALELLHKVFRNYGLAIIVLTALINLLLFPLTRVSYMSMKRMQLIQPQMNKLREQHKKNPEKLNKEMMELYKKHKVNPFGGCLPMVLQMPVFIALYVSLSKSVILINSKLLWINDLSSPDVMTLPFLLPFFGNSIHLLPLIMVAAMTVQQKFTQIKMEGQDPAMEAQQKMMSVTMPIIFGFIFYSMPSGLVLYWLTNTLLMTFYQLYLKKITLT